MIKNFLKKWFIQGFSGMAMGLFCTLIAGTILKTIGAELIGDNVVGNAFVLFGNLAGLLMGCGIAVGIGYTLKCDKLVLYSLIPVGFLGAKASDIIKGLAINFATPGDPIGSFVAVMLALEIGMLVSGKVKSMDIVIVPLVVLLTAFASVYLLCPPIVYATNAVGKFIQIATEFQPLLMGMVIALSVGLLLTLPTSSAAICIAMQIGGIAGGAAVVGGACHMIGFAVMSYRDNKLKGVFSIGLGTSMLLIPNVIKKPILLVPPSIASIISGALAATVFKLQCDFLGSGMGTAGLVGIFSTITASKDLTPFVLVSAIIILFFVIPITVCLICDYIMRKKNLIADGDLLIM